MTEKSSHDKIEIRSGKVRNILGEVPNPIIRWGISILFIIFIGLILIVLKLRFPYGNGESIWQHIFSSSLNI